MPRETNWELKAALVQKYGTQTDFGIHAKISPPVLSEIVNRRRKPTKDEVKKLRKGLGEKVFAKVFPEYSTRTQCTHGRASGTPSVRAKVSLEKIREAP